MAQRIFQANVLVSVENDELECSEHMDFTPDELKEKLKDCIVLDIGGEEGGNWVGEDVNNIINAIEIDWENMFEVSPSVQPATGCKNDRRKVIEIFGNLYDIVTRTPGAPFSSLSCSRDEVSFSEGDFQITFGFDDDGNLIGYKVS